MPARQADGRARTLTGAVCSGKIADAQAAAAAPVDEKKVIKRGQRTDMPKIGEKQSELEKVRVWGASCAFFT